MTDPDPALDLPPVPEYAGSADRGVVSSVGEHHPAAGDVVDRLRAEHAKLRGVADELQDRGLQDRDELRRRWGGVVREVREHLAAELRVVLPVLPVVEAGVLRDEAAALLDALAAHDALTPDDVDPAVVPDLLGRVRAHLASVEAAALPALEQLPAEQRARLGEDLRQVEG